MSMPRLKPYSAYRDTGIEWLGEIPAHWSAERLKNVVHLVDLRANGHEGNLPFVGLEHIASGVGRLILQGDQTPKAVDDAAEPSAGLFEPGDVLFGKLRPYLAKVWQAEFAGRCSTELLVLRSGEGKVYTRYLSYQLLSPGFIGSVDSMTYGTKMPRANSEQVLGTVVAVAPLPEQRAIAAFLDRETARIDELIAKKERLIALLQEKRTALITRAVTKGVDPNVPMKDSGVEWLGQIPAHWEVRRTKSVARLATGHTPSRAQPEYWENCHVPWVALSDVWQLRDGRLEQISETSELISELGLRNSAAELLPKGTVVLSRTASVGFSAIMAKEMATTQDFVNWVCGPLIRPAYLLYVFRAMVPEFRRLTMGSTHQTIYMPDVGKFTTPVPPIEEQVRIVEFIQARIGAVDELVDAIRCASERLAEFRSSLISVAVTGKIDVREEAG